ncbi:MAG: DNA primase [Phycisphaerales bacterium]|nr:DNA primase [Phycisphaerales bacterium]
MTSRTLGSGARRPSTGLTDATSVADQNAQRSDRERVRDASDIARIVGEHVALRARGREYVGLCPFHDDHRPSMNVVPAKQIFHCFVCGAGGDVFTFVQKYHRMDFPEALRYLAERAGIHLARRDAPRSADGLSRADLLGANAEAQAFFQALLRHEEHGAAARGVVERRGISPEMVERFGIGASPDRWDGLLLRLRQRQLDVRRFVAAGLLREKDGGWYDTFRNRLTFPIHDKAGRVIAFGGRRIDDNDDPKYLNSPESAVFDKSSAIFGIHQAARAIQREGVAIITEGYTDAIACHQAGFEHVVATLGTALTRQHAAELRTRCDRIVLLFDGDTAGLKAADRAAEVFFSQPVDVRIATLSRHTDAKDPDELLKRPGGAEVFRRVIDSSVELLEYRFERLRERVAGAGLSALERATKEELSLLSDLGLSRAEPIRRQLVIRRLSEVTGLDDRTLAQAARAGAKRRAGGEADDSRDEVAADRPATARLGPAETALGCLLCDGSLWEALSEDQRDSLLGAGYASPRMQSLARAVARITQEGRAPGLDEALAATDEETTAAAAVELHQRIWRETDEDEARLRALLLDCAKRAAALHRHSGPTASGDAASAIERIRSKHRALGGDALALPRPAAGLGPS